MSVAEEFKARLESLEAAAKNVQSLLHSVKRQGESYREQWAAFRRNLHPIESIVGPAGIVTEYCYRFDFALTAASQNVTPVTKTIFPDTTFMCQRLTAHWLPATGTGANRWWAPASSHPTIVGLVQGGAGVNVPDFFYTVNDLASGRDLSDQPLPGDWLYRGDRDGYRTSYPSVFRGSKQVRITVALLAAAPVSGTLYIVMHGLQSVLAPKADVT